jgi:hypothetical protein
LVPVVEATGRLRTPATRITADAGYHSEDNLIGRQSEGAGRKSG